MTQSHGHHGLNNIGEGEGGEWKFQVRIILTDEFAAAVKDRQESPAFASFLDGVQDFFGFSVDPSKTLAEMLDRRGMTLKNQFDAFAGYCAEMEAKGETDTSLYKWTKDTIENPEKKAKYATRFTVYTKDGDQIYDEARADAVINGLEALKALGYIEKIDKISSDPAKNPQAPAKYEQS